MNPFQPIRAPFDQRSINDTISRALRDAGLDTSSGPMRDVMRTIDRALSPGGGAAVEDPDVIDVSAREVRDEDPASGGPGTVGGGAAAPPSSFETFRFGNAAGERSYKVYVPAGTHDAPRPVVVMLHGCTQSADDFAVGTQMNRHADRHGVLVVYPEQPAGANPSRCWNWFSRADQVRGAGEPSILMGIVDEVVRRHHGDPARVFVAGLSAGAAMAVVLGEAYPDRIAGVGAHSGLPYASAHDVPSALAAMKGRSAAATAPRRTPAPGPAAQAQAAHHVPTIVFHGDRDHTVHGANGAAIFDQCRAAHRDRAGAAGAALSARSAEGAANGRAYDVTELADAEGRVVAAHWILHGAGHAWSGGDPRGSHADRQGPDATAEMLRFFLSLPAAGSAAPA